MVVRAVVVRAVGVAAQVGPADRAGVGCQTVPLPKSLGSEELAALTARNEQLVGEKERLAYMEAIATKACGQYVPPHCEANASGNDCDYGSLTAAVNAGSSDVILVADGKATDLGGASLAIPKGAALTNGSNAPDLDSQYGTADLRDIYGAGNSNRRPTISNGTLTVASESDIEGFGFTNSTITNRSTSNVSIRNNTFTGPERGAGASALDGANHVGSAGDTNTPPTTPLPLPPTP